MKNIRFLVLLTFVWGFLPLEGSGQQKYSLHGIIKSKKTGETIIGASISVVGTSIGASSNEYGFYSLSLPAGPNSILVSAVGMKPAEMKISLAKHEELNVELEEASRELDSVTVSSSASGRSLTNPQMGIEKINIAAIKNVPVLFGEKDVFKTMQLLPGVKSVGDGNSGFYVRGGAADQNLVLLDEAPVYNASHLLGFFSTFNSDAIKNVTLYKGDMPPKYGGKLSSVVDIKMNDGNNQDFSMSGGIGLIASRINVEGPIQRDKSSFLVSARRTYVDVFLQLFGDSTIKKTKLYFYDLNTKINFILGEKDKLYLSGYFGRDVLSQDELTGINWGNATATLRWNHIFSNKLFSNTSLIFSNYNYKINSNSTTTNFHILSQIRDWNIKNELQWYLNTGHTLNFGADFIYHTLKPGEISVSGGPAQGLPDRYSLESAFYANDVWRISNRLSVSFGARLSVFSILGEGDYYEINDEGEVTDTFHYQKGDVVKTYLVAEPRVSTSYRLNDNSSIKFSIARNSQNLHLISNSSSTSPTDKWIASTNIIKPELANQFAVGYYRNFKENNYEFSSEAYFKTMANQIDYRDGAEVFTNDPIETQLLFGKGRAYGIELSVKKKQGRLTGWVNYTLSKTERQFAGINNGNWYNARQDRTHDIALVGIYQLNSKWTLSATWVYYTGDAITYPSGKYTIDGEVYFYYSERNGYRMPSYHRLDLGATKQLKKTSKFSSELNFTLYNAYGRSNAYVVNFQESESDPDKTEAVKTSLFNFVPTISYNFKF